MTDLTQILGTSWRPPVERRIDTPEEQLVSAMVNAGLDPPLEILLDGKLHRFKAGTKGSGGNGDKTGWYVAYGDGGIPAGRFGCWRAGIEVAWRADMGRTFTPAEEMQHARRMAEAKAARDAEQAKLREAVADTVEAIWTNAQAASPEHPYLARKGIKPHGARVTGDGRLVVPLYHPDGSLSSLQYIAHDGGKLYHNGGKTGGCMWQVGTTDEHGPIYIAEGFATAATIHETTGRPCVVAYSASNLVPVTESIRNLRGAAQEIIIVADNDSSGTGQKYADQASAKFGARVIMPPVPGDANDYAAAGHDLTLLLNPPKSDWLIPADDFSAQPAPISWLVKKWIQNKALCMIHGPSGGGKTFVILDMCLRMAAGIDDWCGQRVRPGEVVYLAGEGHHGLRGRIAAWKHHHGAGALNMWLSKAGCDLNTPAGYLKVRDAILALETAPKIIVVDTLHRFLFGDENSAQDAKTMLDACAGLMSEFNCTVILVHHTGVSDEAQHRARGSSAWRGALDIEISVVPGKDGKPIEIVQRKSKDAEAAEPVFVELRQVEIPGWIDEDGEQVTSAVIAQADAPAAKITTEDKKIRGAMRDFETAWRTSGSEVNHNGRPYLSSSAARDWLVNVRGVSEQSARQYVKKSSSGRWLAILCEAGKIEEVGHGFEVICETEIAAFLIR